jgi:hypothetical protein
MIHFYLSSYLKRTGAHFGVGISSPFDYSKNPSVIKKYGDRKVRKLKSKGFVLVQLQDERAEQVRCGLTPDEARNMADELRRVADEVESKRKRLRTRKAMRNKLKR